MLEKEEVLNLRKKDAEREKVFLAKLEGLREEALEAASRRFAILSEKLRGLLTEKVNLQKGPLTREEVLAMAVEGLLLAQKENSLERLLSKHLAACMRRENIPLNADFLKSQFFTPADFWRVVYFLLNEDILKKSASTLPAGGVSRQEREKQITRIDGEISQLEGQLETLAGEEK